VWWKAEERWNTQCLGLYGSHNGGAPVSNVSGCIVCKDGVGTITDVEGNINSAKCVDIFDNNILPVVLKIWKLSVDFQRWQRPGTPVRTDKIIER
jgi:hypothetical protein